MTKDEALKLALEALHGFVPYLPLEHDEPQCDRYDQAITAIKAALEAKDEPYGYVWFTKQMEHRFTRVEPHLQMDPMNVKPVYATPPQRTWVGLTDEDEIDWQEGGNLKDLVKAIEAKLKAKNS
jgi:hypothetical protein